MKYSVDFSYSEPRWGNVELEADDADAAADEAEKWISMTYPEAMDIEIDGVDEVNGE